MRTKDEWQQILEAKLPPKHHHVARNQAITAHYASWYLQRPHLFKWSGMAALVSYQIGLGLRASTSLTAPYDLVASRQLPTDGGVLGMGFMLSSLVFKLALSVPAALHDFAARQMVLNDLDVIRKGNNEIFNDIGWAHVAYMHDGITAIEAHATEAEREFMLCGFQMIDEGARKLENPAECEAGKRLIRTGNIYVLIHEQLNVAQPIFQGVTAMGRVVASLGSGLDFTMVGGADGGPWFGGHFGYVNTVSRQRCVSNFEDRLEWLEKDLLPAWDKLDASYCESSALHQRLQVLAKRAPVVV